MSVSFFDREAYTISRRVLDNRDLNLSSLSSLIYLFSDRFVGVVYDKADFVHGFSCESFDYSSNLADFSKDRNYRNTSHRTILTLLLWSGIGY